MPSIPRQSETSNEYVGIMSQTLAPSSVVRWILPARIRSRRLNDIVFVGDTYLQLREFLPNGQLADATAKVNLHTQILGAKVISAKVEKVPILDAVLGQEVDEERFIIKGKPCSDDQPPQIVVVHTAANELVYVYATISSSGYFGRFVFAKRSLFQGVSVPQRYSKHIAIDSECKVLAIASEAACTVMSLKDVDDLQACIDAWDPRKPQSFQPILEQRFIQMEGSILKMDFLHPTEEEPEKATLLLIVANEGHTSLVIYKWDTRESLVNMKPASASGYRLQSEDSLPLLLIPSTKPASFAIVTETHICFYDAGRLSVVKRREVTLPNSNLDREGRMWVQWAKPSRHMQYSQENEDILLVRADGKLWIFTRTHNSLTNVSYFSPGELRISVDSAVCMLPGPRGNSGDTLIVGGDMTDGGVFHIPSRESIYSLQTIPNVSPVHDMAILETKMAKQKDIRHQRTFVTTGTKNAGSLHELRFGQEAQIGWKIPYKECATANRLWALNHPSSPKLYIMMSHPEHTSVLAHDYEAEKFEMMDPSSFPGLQNEIPTLAADSLGSGAIIQITKNRINVSFDDDSFVCEPLENCICGDIDSENQTIAVASYKSGAYDIQLCSIRNPDGLIKLTMSPVCHSCVERPLSLELFGTSGRAYLAAGYMNGDVDIFSIDTDGQLVQSTRLRPLEPDNSAVASIVVLAYPDADRILILVGTRSGKLELYSVLILNTLETQKLEVEFQRTYRIGYTTTSVSHDRCATSDLALHALVQCESHLERVTFFRNRARLDYLISSVWLTTRNDLSFAQPNLNAVQTIRHLKSPRGNVPHGLIICATDEELLITSLIPEEQMIPRRIELGDHEAYLMVFLKTLNKYVIGGNPIAGRSSPLELSDVPEMLPTLHLIDPDQSSKIQVAADGIVLGENRERITAMLPWEPTDGKRHFELIMIALSDGRYSRLGFVVVKKLARNPKSASLKSVQKFVNKRVHALFAFETSSLLISAGRELIILRLDVALKKWHEDARYGLPSPALSISTQGSVIYAATASHSTIMLKWNSTAKTFEKLTTDRIARNARLVLPFGKQNDHLLVTLATDQGTSLLAYPFTANSSKFPTPLFEAHLPVALHRIAQVPCTWPTQSQRVFQGISLDGTIYLLRILARDEVKLLRFLEDLVQPDIGKPAKKPIALLTEKMARNYIRALKEENMISFNPRRMHIRGDVLNQLIDAGSDHLRSLIGIQIKDEDDRMTEDSSIRFSKFQTLAKPLVGEADDMAAAVIAWMRDLMRSTTF